jgi:hypothetical protein
MKRVIKRNPYIIDFYQYLNRENQNECFCKPIESKSFSSQTNYANISNYTRVANILTSSYNLGGRTQFGNSNEFVRQNQGIGIGLGPRNKF